VTARPGSRGRRAAAAIVDRGETVTDRSRDWMARQDVSTRPGTAIGWWKLYKRIDGPVQSLLLTTYVFLAVLPALLVFAEYMDHNPASLATHLVHRFGLTGSAAHQLRSLLTEDRRHELGSALFAILTALFFGLGFGRVVQHVYSRAWRIELRVRLTDQLRYGVVLVVLFAMILLLETQTKELAGDGFWAGAALTPVWLVVLTAFFVWAPWMLTHRRLDARDLVPGAALTALGLVVLMYLSTILMPTWVDIYATDFSALGMMVALFFWFGLSATVIVVGAGLSPILAERRDLLRSRWEELAG
jgi:membrane protein